MENVVRLFLYVSSLYSILIIMEELNNAENMINQAGDFEKPEFYILDINKMQNDVTKLKI